MAFLDPPEGIRINELLATGDPVAAARLLLASSNREHKAIRPHVTECVNQLMLAAKAAFVGSQILTARDHARLAAELRPLSGDHAVLGRQIEESAAEVERRAAAEKAAVDRSRKLADAGRLHTSIESLVPIQHLPEGQELLAELSVRDVTMQRHAKEFDRLLEQADLLGAEVILRKIEEVARSSATARQCRNRLDQAQKAIQPALPAEKSSTASSSTTTSTAINPDDRGWLLNFGHPDRNTLLVFGHCFVIGSSATEKTTAEIQVCGATLHRQHALILRHFRHDEMRYWLMPHPSHDKFVAVNGVSLTPGSDGLRPWERSGKRPLANSTVQPVSELGCVLLQDGDVIQMGNSQHEASVRLVFRQRLEPSNQVEKAGTSHRLRATAGLQFDSASPGKFQNQGVEYRNLALVHEEVRLGSSRRQVDLPLEMKFDGAICYRLHESRLSVSVDGAPTDLLGPNGEYLDDHVIQAEKVLSIGDENDNELLRVIHRCF